MTRRSKGRLHMLRYHSGKNSIGDRQWSLADLVDNLEMSCLKYMESSIMHRSMAQIFQKLCLIEDMMLLIRMLTKYGIMTTSIQMKKCFQTYIHTSLMTLHTQISHSMNASKSTSCMVMTLTLIHISIYALRSLTSTFHRMMHSDNCFASYSKQMH